MFNLDEYNKKYYELISSSIVSEQGLEIYTFRHIVTDAKIVLMVCDDKNRVFNIAFKTPVENGKGTPHILEHSVLCGSRKYNVKDPFIELAKSSMNTFLNAMTFPDKTCYPVASANLKDFHNLMDVYLDAVFYPNAVKTDKIFRQEGWHYEIEDVKSELKVNGVVLNEMKGVYSNPDDILEYSILKSLYDGTNYSYESGGSPDEIIDLTFDEFKDFHKKYYSPTNAIIYLYGDLDYNQELKDLQDKYLKDFEYVNVNAEFKSVKDFKRDEVLTSYYNVDNTDTKDKAYISYNFSIDKKKTSVDKIVMIILDYILFSSESAILRNKFLEMGLGESVYTFSEYSVKDAFYSIISQNIDESKKEKFIDELFSSIQEILYKGIDKNKLKSAINILHFQYAEGEFGRMPKGLVHTLTSLDTYLYGEGVDTLLSYKDAFDFIKSVDLDDKNNIFYKTIREVFIDNSHRSVCLLLPKYGYLKEKDERLKDILKDRKESFDDAKLLDCINSCKELKTYQSTKDSDEDLKCIPTLKLSDLEEPERLIDFDELKVAETPAVVSFGNDREVIYMDMHFDLTGLTNEEIYLSSLINMVLTKIDMKSMTYVEFDDYISMNSGGLNVQHDVYEDKFHFTIGVKIFVDKCLEGLDILYRVLTDSKFDDNNRINMIINENKANVFVNILSSGHIAASTRAGSTVSFSSGMLDKISSTGVAKYQFIDNLSKNYLNNHELFDKALTLLYKKVVQRDRYYVISMNEKYKDEIIDAYTRCDKKITEYIKENPYTSDDEVELKKCIEGIKKIVPFDSFEKRAKKEAIVIPSDVNFVAIANSFDESKYTGKFDLIRTIFNYEYLWTNIRVLGGAYGCMSAFRRNGNYMFVTYRDPNFENTIKVFDGIYSYLKDISISADMLVKYIIGSIGVYDNPISIVDNYKKNAAAYFNGHDDADVKERRRELIGTKPSDLNVIAEVFDNIKDSSSCALISEKKVEEADKLYDKVWKLTE